MCARVRAAWPGARLCAPVLTVRCTPGDNLAIHVAVARAPRAALVVTVGDDEEHGYWGEVLTTAARTGWIAGLVIEGGVRDVAAVQAVGFPVFSTMVALKGTTKHQGGEVGAPVEVGGVRVCTGDWVVADSDGVAVIRADMLDEVTAAFAGKGAEGEPAIRRSPSRPEHTRASWSRSLAGGCLRARSLIPRRDPVHGRGPAEADPDEQIEGFHISDWCSRWVPLPLRPRRSRSNGSEHGRSRASGCEPCRVGCAPGPPARSRGPRPRSS